MPPFYHYSSHKTKWCEFYWRSHGCKWGHHCTHAHNIWEYRGPDDEFTQNARRADGDFDPIGDTTDGPADAADADAADPAGPATGLPLLSVYDADNPWAAVQDSALEQDDDSINWRDRWTTKPNDSPPDPCGGVLVAPPLLADPPQDALGGVGTVAFLPQDPADRHDDTDTWRGPVLNQRWRDAIVASDWRTDALQRRLMEADDSSTATTALPRDLSWYGVEAPLVQADTPQADPPVQADPPGLEAPPVHHKSYYAGLISREEFLAKLIKEDKLGDQTAANWLGKALSEVKRHDEEATQTLARFCVARCINHVLEKEIEEHDEEKEIEEMKRYLSPCTQTSSSSVDADVDADEEDPALCGVCQGSGFLLQDNCPLCDADADAAAEEEEDEEELDESELDDEQNEIVLDFLDVVDHQQDDTED
jgi:hypothetical protein